MADKITQSQWLRVLINKGVNPDINVTAIPRSVFDATTISTAIIQGMGTDGSYYNVLSISGYGMGWWQQSIDGREVCVNRTVSGR